MALEKKSKKAGGRKRDHQALPHTRVTFSENYMYVCRASGLGFGSDNHSKFANSLLMIKQCFPPTFAVNEFVK